MSLLDLQDLAAADGSDDRARNPEASTLTVLACDSNLSVTLCQ